MDATSVQIKPTEIKLEVTYKCPQRCVHCSSEADQNNSLEMSENDCLRILKEAASLGTEEVAFSGGEPLIWHSIEKAVKYAKRLGMRVLLYSCANVEGIEGKLTSLKKLGLDRFIVSLFGASKKTHEEVTSTLYSFENCLKALKLSQNLGIETEIHFVPLQVNYQELEPITLLARRFGITLISVLRFVPQGRGSEIDYQVLDREQFIFLRKDIMRLRKAGHKIRTGSPLNFLMVNGNPKCRPGIEKLIVGPDLSIAPCDAFKQIDPMDVIGTRVLANLKENSLKECWEKSPYFNAIRQYLSSPPEEPCNSCDNYKSCMGGCVAQKIIEHGCLMKCIDPCCLVQVRQPSKLLASG